MDTHARAQLEGGMGAEGLTTCERDAREVCCLLDYAELVILLDQHSPELFRDALDLATCPHRTDSTQSDKTAGIIFPQYILLI